MWGNLAIFGSELSQAEHFCKMTVLAPWSRQIIFIIIFFSFFFFSPSPSSSFSSFFSFYFFLCGMGGRLDHTWAFLVLCSGTTLADAQGTMHSIEDGTMVSHIQGKWLTPQTTMSLAPSQSFLIHRVCKQPGLIRGRPERAPGDAVDPAHGLLFFLLTSPS